MHEAMVAQNLLATILAQAEQQAGPPVHAKISCGQLNTLHQDVFEVAFAALAEGSVCAGMTFEVEIKPFRANCETCGHEFPVAFATASCPACNSRQFQLLPDAPLVLETIEFREE